MPKSLTKSRLEALLSMATGAAAEVPAGLAGLYGAATGGSAEGVRMIDKVRGKLTYQPRDPRGQQEIARALGPIMQKIEAGKSALGDGAFNATGSPMAAAAAYTAPEALLSLLGARPALAAGRSASKGIGALVERSARLPAPAMGSPASQLGIIDPATVLGWGKSPRLPDSDEFAAAVANTPGAAIGDGGLTMRLQRNQHPDQAYEPSVRGGVFYLPEGAPQAKHYSTGKSGYGGRERIEGETLIQSPMFVKGATGGKAPEAAFDLLNGKGAYQSMRADAIKAYGPYGAGMVQRAASVREFLEKYAPELADYADYIADKSKQGNQLAYALQEAAAAAAARKAGYDAILGYSRQRSGGKQPFISEVFDVRERTYPSADGDFEVWDEVTE